MRKAECVTTF